jgi:hypothetical protein
MRTNRFLLPVIVTIFTAIGISSCTYRANYGPDYGYRYHHRHYRYAPPPPRVVVVKPAPPRRVIRADRQRHDRRNYDRQYRRGNHYGHQGRTYGPR